MFSVTFKCYHSHVTSLVLSASVVCLKLFHQADCVPCPETITVNKSNGSDDNDSYYLL